MEKIGKSSRINAAGFSIIEVMIAMGMLGVVSMGSVTLFNQTQQNQNALTTSTVTSDFVEDIRTMMGFSSVCTANFLGTQIDPYINPIPVTSIKDANSIVQYQIGSDYEERTLRLTAIALENFTKLSAYAGRLELVVDLEKLKSTGSVQSIRRKIPLVANLDGNGKIRTCYAGGGSSPNTPQICEDMGGRYDMNGKRCVFKQISVTDFPGYYSNSSMLHVITQAAGDVVDVDPSGKVYLGPRPDVTVQFAYASALGYTNPTLYLSNDLTFGNNTDIGAATANPAGKLMGYLGGNEGHNIILLGSYNKNVTSVRLWNWNGDPNVPGAGWDMGLIVRDILSHRQCVGPQLWCGRDDYLDKGIMNNVANETLKVYENASFTGTVFAAGSALTSDRRLKKNIYSLTGSLSKVLQLRGVEYEWREESGNSDKAKQLGLIAQEVESIYPDAVTETPSGFKSIKYYSLIAPLIESLKEIWQHVRVNREEDKLLEDQVAKAKEGVASQVREIRALRAIACDGRREHPACSGSEATP